VHLPILLALDSGEGNSTFLSMIRFSAANDQKMSSANEAQGSSAGAAFLRSNSLKISSKWKTLSSDHPSQRKRAGDLALVHSFPPMRHTYALVTRIRRRLRGLPRSPVLSGYGMYRSLQSRWVIERIPTRADAGVSFDRRRS
jgi:hypothetical protein